MSSTKLNMEGILLFEQPFVRVRRGPLQTAHYSSACRPGSVRELPEGLQDVAAER